MHEIKAGKVRSEEGMGGGGGGGGGVEIAGTTTNNNKNVCIFSFVCSYSRND